MEGHYGGGEGDGAPFIWELASPSLPHSWQLQSFLLADSHEKSACQGPWRRKKITGHQKKKKGKKKQNLKSKQNKSLPQETRRANSTSGPRSGQTGKTSWPTPQGEEILFNVLLLCSRGKYHSPETSTHWPLVSFFF